MESTPEQQLAFTFVRGSNYLALPRSPQPWLIDKVIPAGGLANVFGQPKLGKSFAALAIAEAIADPAIEEWMGFPVKQHGPVAYLQVDTPRSEWAERVEKLRATGHNIDNIHFTDALLTPYPVELTADAQREALKLAIAAIRPVLLVVDTLREIHGGDENDSGAMRAVISAVVDACRHTDTAILFVSHSRKEAAAGGGGKWGKPKSPGGDDDDEQVDENDLMEGGRGSSYVSGRMDVVIRMTKRHLTMKGRAIDTTRVAYDKLPSGMIVRNQSDAENEAHIKYVLSSKQLSSERQRAEMLAAMENIKVETARSRLRAYRAKHGGMVDNAESPDGESANL